MIFKCFAKQKNLFYRGRKEHLNPVVELYYSQTIWWSSLNNWCLSFPVWEMEVNSCDFDSVVTPNGKALGLDLGLVRYSNLWQIYRQLQTRFGFSAGKDIKNWHASFQDLANMKKLHQTPCGMSLHQFHLRRRPLAKNPSSSNLYQASGCTAGRQSDFMQGFLVFPSQKSSGFITSSQFHQQEM